MLLQDFQTITINFYLPLDLHPGAFKAQIKATDAREQAADRQHSFPHRQRKFMCRIAAGLGVLDVAAQQAMFLYHGLHVRKVYDQLFDHQPVASRTLHRASVARVYTDARTPVTA